MDRVGFRKELEHIINKYSMESASNTPDFILARYLMGCLAAFEIAVVARGKWYGSHPVVDKCVEDPLGLSEI